MTPKKVLYFTNIAPHYRNRLWLMLAREKSLEFHFFFGKPGKSEIKVIDFRNKDWRPFTGRINYLNNIRILDIIFWQKGVIGKCMEKENNILIFLGQYHILSNWIAAAFARLLGKQVIFWGHGFHGKAKGINKWIRKMFYSLAHDHLVYNNLARELMIQEGFSKSHIHILYNSLDYKKHLQLREKSIIPGFYSSANFFERGDLPVLIFIGRLTSVKRIDLLIRAVTTLNSSEPNINLIIVGAGPMEKSLRDLAEAIQGNCYFYGASYDETVNGRLIANADLCVSPGDVGLTAIHSFSFGTPVCTHENMIHQMPEAEAIQNKITGILFKENDKHDLMEKINEWLLLSKDREKIREACYEVIDEYYNPYFQLSVFKKVLLKN